jgi:hypothetical protein
MLGLIESGDTGGVKRFLSAAEVLELAELLEEEPLRVGVVDEVLQAAAERRGMTLVLADTAGPPRPPARLARPAPSRPRARR